MANYNFYTNKLIIKKENYFLKNKKQKLNIVEQLGLEAALLDFICEFLEEEGLSEMSSFDNAIAVSKFVRWNEASVDFLDGVYDTYVFDNYAIDSVWMTENGIIMMDVTDLSSVIDKEDIWEGVLRDSDRYDELPSILFRLN